MRPTMSQVEVLSDPNAVALTAAERFAATARSAVATRGRFAVALSGGSSPRQMYSILARPPYRDGLPWTEIHVFLADERYVPHTDPESNFGQLGSLLLNHVDIPEANVHPMRTDIEPPESARQYSQELATTCGSTGLDLIMLGVGEDGHVASVFPGSEALYVEDRGASAHMVNQVNAWRITLTLAEINAADSIVFVVTGPDKACALANIATGHSGLPAERVRPAGGEAVWLVDEAAATRLSAATTASETDVEDRLTARSSAPATSIGDADPNPSPKQRAGEAAAAEVASGMALGLGTGSTARFVTLAIGRRLQSGEISDVVAVPTSQDTARLARECGIPLVTLAEKPRLDLAIDGADEVSPELNLIKGLGAALLREKIVAMASERFVVVADVGKQVTKLGTLAPVPVAVVQFGWTSTVEALRRLGAAPVLRTEEGGCPVVSDDGLYMVDCRFADGIDDPHQIDDAIRSIPGAVETGLFLDIARSAYLGEDDGVLVLPPV